VKELSQLLRKLKALEIIGSTRSLIRGVCIDSRQVKDQFLFAAISGSSTDGHLYIDQAIESGAVAILCERLPEQLKDGITYILVKDAALAIGEVAAAFYGYPSSACKVVGITGTNGKTTTATLLYDLFKGMGYRAGLISTVEVRIDELIEPATHTTPDPISLQRLLGKMVDSGCTHVFMEVSSHAIHQRRIAGIEFAGGVFTNMSHDHLDYHGTFDEYIKAKKLFFDELSEQAFALVNVDDKRGEVMIQNCRSVKRRYGLKSIADYKARIIQNTIDGLHLMMDGMEMHARVIGEYNAYNLLAAYGTAICLDADRDKTLITLSRLRGAEGRFEYVVEPGREVTAVVDYAHTPDALEKVIQTASKLLKANTKLIVVVGCGGDRDKTKRPVMGKIALSGDHRAILTSDNPRSEDPDKILEDMCSTLSKEELQRCLVITDRKMAIKTASQLATKGDIILIAGKGHEKYQEIKGVKHPFDDMQIIKEIFGLT